MSEHNKLLPKKKNPLQTCFAGAVLCKVWDNAVLYKSAYFSWLISYKKKTHSECTWPQFFHATSLLSSTSITRMYGQLISDSCLITQHLLHTHILSLCATWHEAAAYDNVSPAHSFTYTNSRTFCIMRGRPCPCWYRFTFMWLVIGAFLARPGLLSQLNGLHCALPLFPELSLCLARHYDYSRACGGLVAFVLRRHWSTGSPHTCPHIHQHTLSLQRWLMAHKEKKDTVRQIAQMEQLITAIIILCIGAMHIKTSDYIF